MLLLVAMIAAAGGHAAPADHVGPRMLKIVVGDGYLRAPERIEAGPVRIRFASEGRATYQLQIAKVPDGLAIDNVDVLAASGEQLSWVRFRPAGESPLRSAGDVLTELEPGRYLLVVVTDGPKGEAVRRLVRTLTVAATSSTSHLALGRG